MVICLQHIYVYKISQPPPSDVLATTKLRELGSLDGYLSIPPLQRFQQEARASFWTSSQPWILSLAHQHPFHALWPLRRACQWPAFCYQRLQSLCPTNDWSCTLFSLLNNSPGREILVQSLSCSLALDRWTGKACLQLHALKLFLIKSSTEGSH